MAVVRLGNHAALDRGRVIDGPQVTTVTFMDEDDIDTRMRTLTHPDGLWPSMSAAPAAWVECDDDPQLAEAVAEHFGCPIGQPN
jgi:hypothetical protein